MKKHFLRSAFFAAMAALMLASAGCGKDGQSEDPKPDEPKPENLAPKFDAAFAAALQSKGVIKDAKNITAEEIAGVKSIDVSGTSSNRGTLTSLKGIEFFKALTSLNVDYNNLASLDLKSNTGLESLSCTDNNLTSLDLRPNAGLVRLDCSRNYLKEIKVDGLTKLESLRFSYNGDPLKNIDVSTCSALKEIVFRQCGIQNLDVTKNANLETINAYFNDLESIDISQNPKLTVLDVECNPGKGDSYDGIFYVFVSKDFDVNALPPDFTEYGWKYQTRDVVLRYRVKSENLASKFDVAFAKKLTAKGILMDPELITAEEIAGVKSIDVSGTSSNRGTLTSLKGIEFFKALTSLNVDYNNLASLDLKSNTGLESLSCTDNNLTSLDLRPNAGLVRLDCSRNYLKEIKVDGLTKLESLRFSYNGDPLKNIDVSTCSALKEIVFRQCGIQNLDVTKNANLETINAYFNDLESIDISQNPKLTVLDVECNPGKGDSYDGIFYVFVSKDFDVNALPPDFTEYGWKYQTRDVVLRYYRL